MVWRFKRWLWSLKMVFFNLKQNLRPDDARYEGYWKNNKAHGIFNK